MASSSEKNKLSLPELEYWARLHIQKLILLIPFGMMVSII